VDQYAGSPGRSTYCYTELTAAFINFLYYCLPFSGFFRLQIYWGIGERILKIQPNYGQFFSPTL